MISSSNTPKGFRLHLGIFGRRNAGKSSLLNALTRQKTSIVSDIAGTTTDPVEKPMELLPIGPVLFIDTAGLDDSGELGELRIQKTLQVFDRTEIGLLVVDTLPALRGEAIWNSFEDRIVKELQTRNIPVLIVFNKCDRGSVPEALAQDLTDRGLTFVKISAATDPPLGIADLKDALVQLVPEEFLSPPPIVSDLVSPGGLAVLVVPIDKEAPKGRLILPQVQTIRDLLDGDQACLTVKENRLARTLSDLSSPPDLVVTDSQAFKQVAAIVPPEIPLTSFSILFARQKGNIDLMIKGARALGTLPPRSRILIAEACSHHPIAEDIGTEKIPHWLRQKFGSDLEIDHVHGHDFPSDGDQIRHWDLIIHCGACMWNRREMLSRIARCHEAGVPITNYGLAIAFLHGILDRAVKPLGL